MSIRIGHGYDIHRLQAGGQLVLGTVTVAHDVSLVAHSDGDVVLHAIADALLGAIGAGDIGEHFPNTDATYANAPSTLFIERIKSMLGEDWSILNVDVTVLAERPKLKVFKKEMTSAIGRLLGCPVNVKAGTNEGVDAIGRGEAIAAHAVVLLIYNRM
jgi:2-C-methyl-D-erythritol 2,4-cyclodiphosphate synthase